MLPLVFEQKYFHKETEKLCSCYLVYFIQNNLILNFAYIVRAALNSLYIPLSVLPVVEISAALE